MSGSPPTALRFPVCVLEGGRVDGGRGGVVRSTVPTLTLHYLVPSPAILRHTGGPDNV